MAQVGLRGVSQKEEFCKMVKDAVQSNFFDLIVMVASLSLWLLGRFFVHVFRFSVSIDLGTVRLVIKFGSVISVFYSVGAVKLGIRYYRIFFF